MKTSWRCLSSSSSEDVFKTSSRLLDEDKYIRLSHALQKTSSRRLQDVLVRTNIFALVIRDVFKTSSGSVFKASPRRLQKMFSRRLQDIFKTSCKKVFKASSRRLQDIFKTFCKDIFKTFWEILQNSQENICVVIPFFDKFKLSSSASFLKTRP